MKLYHGTDRESAWNIYKNGIDLQKGCKNLDFGRGFYTTTSVEKATKRALLKARQNEKRAYIVELDIDERIYEKLQKKEFRISGKEWSNFVMNNRAGGTVISENTYKDHNLDNRYDIVSGEIADGEVAELGYKLRNGEIQIKDVTSDMLRTKKHNFYGKQISFHTEKALSCIDSIKCDNIKIYRKGCE